jgi:ribosome biogenesis GTPase YqeH
MSHLRTIRRCPGCGLILQSVDAILPGYVPQKHVEKHEVLLCQRCFKLQHYGEDIAQKESFKIDDFLTILHQAKQDNAVIIWVLDLMFYETSLSLTLLEALKGIKTYFVGTKRDLLPKSLSNDKLKAQIETFLKERHVIFEDILIASTKIKESLVTLQTIIAKQHANRDLYIFGAASSGKSSLINAFLKHFSNQTNKPITTSPFPGTTLRVIEIPLTSSQTIYDTPGYVAEHSLLNKVEKEVIKLIMPKVELKPKHYRLGAKESLAIGGLVRVDVLSGPKVSLSIYVANPVTFHRFSLIKAEERFYHLLKRGLLKPFSKRFVEQRSFTVVELTLPSTGRQDISISGLGWISIPCFGQVLQFVVPDGTLVAPIPTKVGS